MESLKIIQQKWLNMATLNNFIDIRELTPEFENQLWKAADKLRKKVEVHQY